MEVQFQDLRIIKKIASLQENKSISSRKTRASGLEFWEARDPGTCKGWNGEAEAKRAFI